MKKILGLSLLITSSVFIGCSDNNTDINPETEITAAKTKFVTNYVNIVAANYNDALAKTKELKTAIDAFVAAPDANKFQAAKDAWF